MSRVLLVNLPFYSLRWPNLGPSLLKAGLAREGIDCDIAYLNFDFAEQVGWDDYHWIADHFGFVLGGERLFAKQLFAGLPDDDAYFREVLLASDPEFSGEERRQYEAIGRHVEPFFEHCQQTLDWRRYEIVGFACSFQQTVPSLALARWLRQSHPLTTIVFGGAACEGEMGQELQRRFPEIDYVFLGEADLTFPAFVKAVLAGRSVESLPGVVGRETAARPPHAGVEHDTVDERFPLADLDRLPDPDFDDYFDRVRRSGLAGRFTPQLFFEASRGCWWGHKHHCVFCGLNGSRLAYRSKSPERVIGELRRQAQRYDTWRASSADNIFDHRYFHSLLPRLAAEPLGLAFIFEMKTNLTRAQADLLVAAGLGGAQLGIETFDTSLLKHIGKGTKAIHNLQALKWFSEAGIEVKWNFLYGFPREDPGVYVSLAELLPSLFHLAAPLGAGRVRVDRFAPYFETPDRFGIVNLRPHRAFRHVYPLPEESLARLAYYFEHDQLGGDPHQYAAGVMRAVARWQELDGRVTLRWFDRDDGVLILTDTRPVAAAIQHRLSGWQRVAYRFCDTGQLLARIGVHLEPREDFPGIAALRQQLDVFCRDRLMVYLDDRYLALATRAPR